MGCYDGGPAETGSLILRAFMDSPYVGKACDLHPCPAKEGSILCVIKELVLSEYLLRCSLFEGRLCSPVTTRAFDNSRSGANTHESIVTRDSVVARGIHRVDTIPVYGDARGAESQPLILPGMKLKDGSTHDVMILPSMANSHPTVFDTSAMCGFGEV